MHKEILHLNEKLETIAISIPINNNWDRILLISYYHVPDTIITAQDWYNLLYPVSIKFKYWHIGGDANCHHPYWSPHKTTISGSNLIDALNDINLIILNNNSPTRVNINPNFQSLTTVDITLSSPDLQWQSSWKVMNDLMSSDHFTIKIHIECSYNKFPAIFYLFLKES